MRVPDRALKLAMADAVEGQKVLFLTPSRLSTNGIVTHALDLAILILGAEAKKLFCEATSPWHIRVKNAGWLFFFPSDEINPSEDVGEENPDRVYFPKSGISYKRMPYKEWRAQGSTPKRTGPRSVWERLLDDE